MERLLKVEEAAQVLAMSRSKLYQMIKDNEIPYVRIGKSSIRLQPEALRAWVENLPLWVPPAKEAPAEEPKA